MEDKLFTPKEKYHIASTVAVLFLIQAALTFLLQLSDNPLRIVRGYSILLFLYLSYIAVMNYIKIDKNNVETII